MTIRIFLGAATFALLASQAQAVSGGGFSLSIRNQAEDHRGYVRMAHGAVYAVCFRNDLNRAADAELSIDGLPMGTWRLGPYQRACVDRPAADTGQFTFYRADSAEGYAVGSGQVARPDKGRVSVGFYPEVDHYLPAPTPYAAPSLAPAQRQFSDQAESSVEYGAQSRSLAPGKRLGAGVTGLSGQSQQHFTTAGPIERDYARAVTLELRLVHDPAFERPPQPRPLPGRYDRYAPPPVGY